jgi:hypothetical protein
VNGRYDIIGTGTGTGTGSTLAHTLVPSGKNTSH